MIFVKFESNKANPRQRRPKTNVLVTKINKHFF